jgi:hypothetical protein
MISQINCTRIFVSSSEFHVQPTVTSLITLLRRQSDYYKSGRKYSLAISKNGGGGDICKCVLTLSQKLCQEENILNAADSYPGLESC